MTDIKLNSVNDLDFTSGRLWLIDTQEELIRQRLLNRLRTFKGTLFTDIDYGIEDDLVFRKGTQGLLDQHLKDVISSVKGIVSLVSFSSTVGSDRIYVCNFTYKIESGAIVGIDGLSFGSSGIISTVGVWNEGKWDYSNFWNNDEIWGS